MVRGHYGTYAGGTHNKRGEESGMRRAIRGALSFVLAFSMATTPLAPVGEALALEQGEGAPVGLVQEEEPAELDQDDDTTVDEESKPEDTSDLDEDANQEEGAQTDDAGEQDPAAVEGEDATAAEALEGSEAVLVAQTAFEQAFSQTYVDRTWDSGSKTVVETEGHSPEETYYFPSSIDDNTLSSGWYYLDKDVTIDGRLILTGNTNLILGDDCTLNVKGIYISYFATLHIYSKVGNCGHIVTTAADEGAGIGAYGGNRGGNVVVHGGDILAYGGTHSAGIGGTTDNEDSVGSFTIYGGKVDATGGQDGAGIGGGLACKGGNITIYGGEVVAQGGHYGAGIGGGNGQDKPVRGAHAGTINIWGGTVTATGGGDGAGIGGGEGGNAGSISIYGGTVTAQGGSNGAGIGGGEAESTGTGGTVSIYDGEVTATGGEGGAGIGGGDDGNCTVTISGGKVWAYNGGENGAGIGGGSGASGGTITISGGTVVVCSRDGAGIGGGDGGTGGTITITGGIIYADPVDDSQGNGAGIGGGQNKDGGTINISGGKIYVDGKHGAGIGGGRAAGERRTNSGGGGNITITGGHVEATSDYGFGIGAGGQQGNINFMRNGNADYIGGAGTIIIGGTAEVEAYGCPSGIGGDTGKIYIQDECRVVSTGSLEHSYGCGILLLSEDGGDHIEISGGTTYVDGLHNRPGIKSEHGFTISGGSVFATSGENAIQVSSKIKYYDTAKFMVGDSESTAKVLKAAERADAWNTEEKKYNKYFSITPCDHPYQDEYGLCPSCMHQAFPVNYVERSWDGSAVVEKEQPSPEGTKAFPTNGKLDGGWYYLNRNITVDGRVTIEHDTNLILADKLTLDVKGIYVPKGVTLTIYGQSEDSGTIKSHPSAGAGIGAYKDHVGGNVVIKGGTIVATGHDHCAGIGGNDGQGSNVGSFTMYGGTVTATGGSNGAGIGGGRECDAGKIAIYGGTLTATGQNDSAGIGGGDSDNSTYGNAGDISIYGGTVTATCPGKGAAIGGADYGTAVVSIMGGTVTATCSGGGKGVGGGAKKIPDESSVTLDYTGASWGKTSIKASSYGGTVKLAKDFRDRGSLGSLFVATESYGNLDDLAGKTLVPVSYAVTIKQSEGGTVAADKSIAAHGETVTLTATPDEGYELEALTVKGEDGTSVEVTDGAFAMPSGGVTVTASWKKLLTEPAFRTHSLLLDGAIGVRFFMELPELAGVDYTTSYMEFSVSGRGGKVTTDPFDSTDTNAAGTYYAFSCYVSSIQMADTITATFHYTQADEEKTVTQDYSVAQYVAEFDQRADEFDETTVNLVHAMADYGHYVQPRLSSVNGWKIGTDYAEMPASSVYTAETVAEARTKAEKYAVVADLPQGGEVLSVAMGLNLTSSTDVYASVKLKEGASVSTATLADGTALRVQKISNGRWRIFVTGIMAHHLADTFDITIKTTGGTIARVRMATTSFVQVLFAADSTKSDEAAQYMATSILRYWEAADAYMRVHVS